MERTVSRSELWGENSTTPSSPNVTAPETVKTSQEFVYVQHQNPITDIFAPAEDEDLEYILFAPDSTSKQTTQKITIRTPTPQYAEPGFVDPGRPHDFYFTSATNSNQFQEAALTGEQVLSQANSLRPGSSYAWKVVRLPRSSVTKAARGVDSTSRLTRSCISSKRKRLGKKTRIRDRRMREAELQRNGKVQCLTQASGGTESDDRTPQPMSETARLEKSARNREKKLKRRAREKKKKAEGLMEVQSGA